MTTKAGVLDLSSITRVLSGASELPNRRDGQMVVSLPGLLANAASSLREMSAPLERSSEMDRQEMERRLEDAQPNFYAFGLEQLGEHLGELMQAFEAGDCEKVRAFFDLYTFA